MEFYHALLFGLQITVDGHLQSKAQPPDVALRLAHFQFHLVKAPQILHDQHAIPAATELPSVATGSHVTPSTTNQLGIKGVGETGTIASPPAVLNAVVDALTPLGVTEIERPATPENIWRAIRDARGGAA